MNRMRFRRKYFKYAAFILCLFFLTTFLKSRPVEDPDSKDQPPYRVNFGPERQEENEKIDWHNYDQIKEDSQRIGNGEHGQPATVLFDPDKVLYNKFISRHAYNGYVSNQIAVDRAVPDVRHPKCASMKYRRHLPSVSIVIPFHEEHLKTLVRTFTTALKRAPEELVKEVLLIDDASTLKNLQEELEAHVRQFPKIRIMRLAKREGAIRARIEGIKAATGDVVFILDSHTEANVNWLPPLLEPIQENYRTVTCPMVDAVNHYTFQYLLQYDHGARGAFNWNMEYKLLPRLPGDEAHPERPYENPMMSGGLYAISRKFYWEISGLDPKLEIWGGEHMDLSFKIWMCGGRMLDIPCSRFGHVYRQFMPFSGNNILDFTFKNYKRIAEIWMDEYKKHVYRRSFFDYSTLHIGDIQSDLEFRRKCRSFDWYMKTVAFDVLTAFPPYVPDVIGTGELRNQGSNRSMCLDFTYAKGHLEKVFAQACVGKDKTERLQNLLYDWRGSIRPFNKRSLCLELNSSEENVKTVVFSYCHNLGGNQMWTITEDYQIKNSGLCLQLIPDRSQITAEQCSGIPEQKWSWEKLNTTAIRAV